MLDSFCGASLIFSSNLVHETIETSSCLFLHALATFKCCRCITTSQSKQIFFRYLTVRKQTMTFEIKQTSFFFPLCLCIFFPIKYVRVNSNRIIETFRFITSSELSACKYIYISKYVLVKTTNVLCKKL